MKKPEYPGRSTIHRQYEDKYNIYYHLNKYNYVDQDLVVNIKLKLIAHFWQNWKMQHQNCRTKFDTPYKFTYDLLLSWLCTDGMKLVSWPKLSILVKLHSQAGGFHVCEKFQQSHHLDKCNYADYNLLSNFITTFILNYCPIDICVNVPTDSNYDDLFIFRPWICPSYHVMSSVMSRTLRQRE